MRSLARSHVGVGEYVGDPACATRLHTQCMDDRVGPPLACLVPVGVRACMHGRWTYGADEIKDNLSLARAGASVLSPLLRRACARTRSCHCKQATWPAGAAGDAAGREQLVGGWLPGSGSAAVAGDLVRCMQGPHAGSFSARFAAGWKRQDVQWGACCPAPLPCAAQVIDDTAQEPAPSPPSAACPAPPPRKRPSPASL